MINCAASCTLLCMTRKRSAGDCRYTLRICVLFPKQMATQSGCVVDHCSWLISAPALYAKIGSAQRQEALSLAAGIKAINQAAGMWPIVGSRWAGLLQAGEQGWTQGMGSRKDSRRVQDAHPGPGPAAGSWDDRSQMSACESSPAVQMWQLLCGAQASALTPACGDNHITEQAAGFKPGKKTSCLSADAAFGNALSSIHVCKDVSWEDAVASGFWSDIWRRTCLVPLEFRDGKRREPDIHHHHLRTLRTHRQRHAIYRADMKPVVLSRRQTTM